MSRYIYLYPDGQSVPIVPATCVLFALSFSSTANIFRFRIVVTLRAGPAEFVSSHSLPVIRRLYFAVLGATLFFRDSLYGQVLFKRAERVQSNMFRWCSGIGS